MARTKLLMLFDKVQAWGINLKIRRLHSWLLLLPFILFAAIFIILGFFLGFHDKMIYKFSYAYVSNHNETDSKKADDGPRNKMTQCPPICNSSNMSNAEFFNKLRLRELLDPGPVKVPIDEIPRAPLKHQSSRKGKSHVIPTVQGPPNVTLIG